MSLLDSWDHTYQTQERSLGRHGREEGWEVINGWLNAETSDIVQWHPIADEMRRKLRMKCWGLLNGRTGYGSWAGKEMEILSESLEEPRQRGKVSGANEDILANMIIGFK